jgi:hypothetical protein
MGLTGVVRSRARTKRDSARARDPRLRRRPIDHEYDLAQLFEPIGSREQMVTDERRHHRQR